MNILNEIYKKRETTTKLTLERVKLLLEYLGNPQEKLKFIHIAGTNGKGSVTSMLTNVLIDAGYKVGKYISPFVDNFYERIQVNNKYIQEQEISDILDKILPYVSIMDDKPSAFEIIVAIAFEYFVQKNCDLVCLEVGLGGRFDATNCISNTLVSLITVIDYDHMEFLGNSLEEIAFEKCGIIKENSNVVSYPMQNIRAYLMIEQMSKIRNNKLIIPDVENLNNIKKIGFNYKFEYNNQEYTLGLNGKHQIYNSLMVIEAITILNNQGYDITDVNIVNGIKDTKFIGRLQILDTSPLIILDGAHNSSGASALREFIIENGKNRNIILIVAIKDGKEPLIFFEKVAKLCKGIIITELKDNVIKCVHSNELYDMAKIYNDNVIIELSHEDAINKAKELCNKDDMILISGSLYLVSEFYNHLNKNNKQ